MGIIYNAWSPDYLDNYDAGYKELPLAQQRKVIQQVRELAALINTNQYNAGNANGNFEIKTRGKMQEYSATIRNADDAVSIANVLINHGDNDIRNLLRDNFRNVFDRLEQANRTDERFVYNIVQSTKLKNFLPMNIKTKGRKNVDKMITNPITGRFISNNPMKRTKTYKEVFGKIKLKAVKYDPLQNYNTIEYKIEEYCVPSFSKSHLLKKEYIVIKDELETIKTPTYIQLTELMNKIDYNLNVYITDEECIQEQTEYKKTLSIMIHDEHMYVLKNSNIYKKFKLKECSQEEYDKVKSEIYTDSYKICDGVKYKLINRFKKINSDLQMKGSFSEINIDFFNQCGIRPIRYINNDLNHGSGFDLNQCYFNILKNKDYIFPVQNGTETYEKFDDKIHYIDNHGFYYVEFKKQTEIELVLFGEGNQWILGYVINDLKLKVNIKYRHVAKSFVTSCPELKHEYMDVIFYTGHLAKYKTTKYKMLECDGFETIAYRKKYENCCISNGSIEIKSVDKKGKDTTKIIYYDDEDEKNDLIEENKDNIINMTKPCVNLSYEYLLKTSGMYAYLSILQYARLQLYYIYLEVKKADPDIKIKKVYTDAIYFNRQPTIDFNKVNKAVSKYGFGVKYHDSQFSWTNTPRKPLKEPIISEVKLNHHNNIIQLLKDNKSFCINARAGYGKSYMIKNKIIPYLEKNNKKYILSATTIKLAKEMDCENIDHILATKQSDLKTINNKFKDIDYLIIDECSLLTVSILNIIQYIKRSNENVNVILLGDINQCSFEANNDTIMSTNLFNNIIENNILSIKWHEKARYNKQYDTFLNGLLEFKYGGKDSNCIKYIKEFFKDQVKKSTENTNDKLVLTYTNNFGKRFGKNEDNKYVYSTVHKAQGETINKKYSIYEVDIMDIKLLYTALSRCTNPKLITLYI